MKIKLSAAYVLAFLCLLFLLQEMHDYAHFFTAKWICGCTGIKRFDSWTVCDHCEVTGNILALVTFAGPAISFSIVWIARSMMSRKNSMEKRSFGFSLLFAANPFVNILAAARGGGDISQGMQMIFGNDGNRRMVNIAALLIVLLLTLPPLWKAIKTLKHSQWQWVLIPIFVIVPGIIEKLVLSSGMNWLLDQGLLNEEIFKGIPLLVILWLILLLLLLFFSFKSFEEFIQKKEKKKHNHH